MYQVKIGHQTFDKIPSSLEEVSFSRFLKFLTIDKDNPIEKLHWALDCEPSFERTSVTAGQIAKVLQVVQPVIDEMYWFSEGYTDGPTSASVNILRYDVPLQVGLLNELPYWAYVVAKHVLKEEGKKESYDPMHRFPQLIAHYLYSSITKQQYDEAKAEVFTEVISASPMLPCIQIGLFLVAETYRLIKVELSEFSGPVDEAIIEAGVEIFEKYGDVNNLDTLSMGDVTKWNDIKALDRGTVYTKLSKLKDTTIFQKAYTEILNREAKRNGYKH
jgi:hypothetical protein